MYSKLVCVSKRLQATPVPGSLSVVVSADSLAKAYGASPADRVSSIVAWLSKALRKGWISQLHFSIECDPHDFPCEAHDHGRTALLSCAVSQLLAEAAADPQRQLLLPREITWCDAHSTRGMCPLAGEPRDHHQLPTCHLAGGGHACRMLAIHVAVDMQAVQHPASW